MRIHYHLTCLIAGVALLESAHGTEEERRRREPIYYDSTIQWHTPDASVHTHVPDEDRIRPEHRERRGDDATERFFGGESAAPPMPLQRQLMLPPPAPAEERRSRNWILPTLDALPGPRVEGETEEPEPSGWGWLYDAIEERQRAVAERDDEQARRDNEEEQAEEQTRRPQRGGLMENGAVFQPAPLTEPQAPLARDMVPVGEREERGSGLRALEQAEAAAQAPERRDDPDPWETRAMNQSVWDRDASLIQSEYARSALNSPFGRSADPDPAASRFQSGPTPRENNPNRIDDGSRRTPAAGFAPTRAGNNDAIWGERSSPPAVSSSFTPAGTGGWSANWSGDSGWQGQPTTIEPIRSTITPVVSPTAPLHNTGRLASP